ncbi:hypothetical protein G9U51_12575 [Calidifontibacter sp. DB0510]|uniref:Uncharacterized protein n=1 Tax=Metallococcus carri TaxID=1656884 RepID=A0A967B3D2_9MICO|nr:hypothetical protein [Metallococcus carri]NHN56615.1 hypothetical protein [Metallococcus carri]NOP38914.1 hypothetical protein [Calidifontibacter sp. DB2511S]
MLDTDLIAEAIAAPPDPQAPAAEPSRVSRRTVAKGLAWSLPTISTAIAAPAYAASPPICDRCAGGTNPTDCFIAFPGGGNNGGHCTCAPGLVCVGTGPLGLLNVCVGTDLALSTCGGAQCAGVCLAPGGAIVTAINTFLAALTAFASAVGTLDLLGLRSCVNQPGLPTNICVAPFNDGRLGALCSYSASCGSNAVVDGLIRTVTGAYNTMISTLSNLGVLVSPKCADGLVCNDIGSAAFSYAGVLGTGGFGVQIGIGFCQCPPQTKTCGPGDPTPFASNQGFAACTP